MRVIINKILLSAISAIIFISLITELYPAKIYSPMQHNPFWMNRYPTTNYFKPSVPHSINIAIVEFNSEMNDMVLSKTTTEIFIDEFVNDNNFNVLSKSNKNAGLSKMGMKDGQLIESNYAESVIEHLDLDYLVSGKINKMNGKYSFSLNLYYIENQKLIIKKYSDEIKRKKIIADVGKLAIEVIDQIIEIRYKKFIKMKKRRKK